MNAWVSWSAVGWHWIIYPLAAAAIAAFTGGWLYYREPPAEAAAYERELDLEQGPPEYLPAPDRGVRGGELHHIEYPGQPRPDPILRPDWLDDQLAKGRGWLYYQIYVKQPRDRARDLAEIAAWAA
jgi:hypothetical protein